MAEVLLTALAQVHLQSIYARFEEIQPGSGDRFASEVEGALLLIGQNPRLFPAGQEGARRIPVWKNRYGIFWIAENRGVIVFAILFLGDDPLLLRRTVRNALNLP